MFSAFEEETKRQKEKLNASLSRIVELEQDLKEITNKPMVESKEVQTKPTITEWFQVQIPPLLMKWMERCYFLRNTKIENYKLKMEMVLLKESFHKAYRGKQDACQIAEFILSCRRPSRLYSMFLNEQWLTWKLLRIYND